MFGVSMTKEILCSIIILTADLALVLAKPPVTQKISHYEWSRNEKRIGGVRVCVCCNAWLQGCSEGVGDVPFLREVRSPVHLDIACIFV